MKHLLILLLLISCGASGQKKSPLDSLMDGRIATTGTRGAIIPVFMDMTNKPFRSVGIGPDSAIMLFDVDSLGAIKILLKNLQELQEREQQLRNALHKSVLFANTVGDYFKASRQWKEFVAAIKKQGYKLKR